MAVGSLTMKPGATLFLLLTLHACAEQAPDRSPTLSIAQLSDPAHTTAESSGGSISSSADEMAYVSMPPASHSGGVRADIRNLRTGQTVRAQMLDGGFDPVAIAAQPDDTLEIAITFVGAGVIVEYAVVPRHRRPTIVRTMPPRNKKDVPLNIRIDVVFSEPMEPASLPSGLRLSTGGNVVPGSFELSGPDGLVATFRPESDLLPATSYELVATVDVADLDGDRLQEQQAFPFTTEPPRTAPVRIRTTTTGVAPDPNGFEITVAGESRWTVPQTPSAFAYFGAVPHGEHVVLIGDVAPNCTPTPATLSISVPEQSEATFAITCVASDGVRVTTTTTGDDPDSDGYVLGLVRSGAHVGLALPPNGTESLYGLLFGDFTLTLGGVAPNCSVIGANPRTVTVPEDGVADVDYVISCQTPDVLAYALPAGQSNGKFEPADVHVIKSNSSQPGNVTATAADDADPAWSPNGARIAFASDRDGNPEIYTMDGDGSNLARLTTDPGRDTYPAWSPDGSRIAFVSDRDGNAEIYVMNVDGGAPVRLTNHAASDDSPAWSPDGTRIAFRSDRDGNEEIYVMNADGSGVLRLTVDGADDRDPAWSPDGTRIAFSRFDRCSDVDGSGTMLCTADILIMSSDGSNVSLVDAGVPQVTHEIILAAGELRQPAWSPDGRKLAVAVSYCGGDGDCHMSTGLWIIDIAVRDAVAVIPGFDSSLTGGRAYPLRPTWRNSGTP